MGADLVLHLFVFYVFAFVVCDDFPASLVGRACVGDGLSVDVLRAFALLFKLLPGLVDHVEQTEDEEQHDEQSYEEDDENELQNDHCRMR